MSVSEKYFERQEQMLDGVGVECERKMWILSYFLPQKLKDWNSHQDGWGKLKIAFHLKFPGCYEIKLSDVKGEKSHIISCLTKLVSVDGAKLTGIGCWLWTTLVFSTHIRWLWTNYNSRSKEFDTYALCTISIYTHLHKHTHTTQTIYTHLYIF